MICQKHRRFRKENGVVGKRIAQEEQVQGEDEDEGCDVMGKGKCDHEPLVM